MSSLVKEKVMSEKYKALFQQGDVLMYKVDELPKNLKPAKSKVLAEGEVTGHCHKIDENTDVFVDENGNLFMEVKAETSTVKHDTHHPIEVPKGLYEVKIVQEHDPFEDAARKVRD
jgi:hypothetical protein